MGKGLKTHSGAKKRFKITSTGKVLFKKACNNHLLTNKGDNNKKDGYGVELSKTHVKKIKTLFPYNQ
ncbi:MAG: 50S ribosomal protein L35 [Candidatus Absconditabacterales bacterium]